MQTKKIFQIITFLFLVFIISFLIWFKDNGFCCLPEDDFSSGGNQVTLSFQFSEEEIKQANFEFKAPVNLSAMTEFISNQESWEYVLSNYGDMGSLVIQIRDKENGQDQKYWQYFVNGEQPQISVDKYFPSNGENIEWKFIKSEF